MASYTCGFLLLAVLVSFSTGVDEGLLQSLNLCKNLMNGAVGLKNYTEHLSVLVNYLSLEVNHQLLDDSEKAVLDNFISILDLVKGNLSKSERGIRVIKEQSISLLHLLNSSASKTDQERLEMIIKFFSALWKNIQEDVKELEDGLRNASNALQISQEELDILIQTLEKLKERNIEDEDTAHKLRLAVMAVEVVGTVAVGVLGTTFAPVAVPVGASLCAYQAWSIMSANAEFSQKQEKFSERIEDYGTVSENTNVLREGLDTTVNGVQDIYAKLGPTKTVAGKDLEYADPQIQFDMIRQFAEDLIKACDTFL